MDRMTRGFHRLGLVGAVPLLLVAAYICFGGFFLAKTASEANDSYTLAVLFAVPGALWYGACRAIAWVVSGFREPA